jgi:hypothetical protein
MSKQVSVANNLKGIKSVFKCVWPLLNRGHFYKYPYLDHFQKYGINAAERATLGMKNIPQFEKSRLKKDAM